MQTNKKCNEHASFNIKRHDGFLFVPSYIKHIEFAYPINKKVDKIWKKTLSIQQCRIRIAESITIFSSKFLEEFQ